jgi:mono/diheme cytochrome c family protein
MAPTPWSRFRFIAVVSAFLCAAGCVDHEGPPPLPGQLTDFKLLYSQNCSGCHGADGKRGAGRPINNPLFLAFIPKTELRRIIEHGVPGTAMPVFAHSEGGNLYPKQVDALVNGIEQSWAKPVSLGGAAFPPYSDAATPADAASGKRLFLQYCFACHGPGAPTGRVDTPEYLALVSNQWLRNSIVAGRSDLGMMDWRFLARGHALANQDIDDLVAYLASKRPAASPNAKSTTPGGTE